MRKARNLHVAAGKPNQIKEAHDIETQHRQEDIMFFSATPARKSYKNHSY